MADSLFRTLADEVNAKLQEILTAEGRKVPEFTFSHRKPFKKADSPVRLGWAHAGGHFVFETKNLDEGEETPITPPLGTRVAIAEIRIWHTSDEEAEHVLDRLWLATRQVASSRKFRWADAKYEYPSELVGEDLRDGVSVIRLMLPVDMPVSAVPDVPDTEITVLTHEWRAGIESPAGEPEAESEYDVNRFT